MKGASKLEQKIKLFETKVAEYKKLFLEDNGVIDSEEQKQLDALQVVIDKVKAKMNDNIVSEVDSGKDNMRNVMNEKLNDLKDELDMMLNVYNLF